MSAYRESAKPPEKSPKPKYVFDVTVGMASGTEITFQMPNITHYTNLKTALRAIHELFVEKWDVDDSFWGLKHTKIRTEGVVPYRKGEKTYVLVLKHVEYYSVEPVQLSQ